MTISERLLRLRRAPKPRAIIFDLDGTLIDSRVDIARACNDALMAMGREPLPVEEVSTFVGDGARMLVARALRAEPHAPEVEVGLGHFRVSYEARPVVDTRLLPGVEACFECFSGLPVALATNKPRRATELVLAGLGIASRFVAVAAGGDGPLKPDPALLEKVLGEMRLAAKDVWMVGDSPQDVGAGRAVGCTTIGVYGFVERDRLAGAAPDVLLDSLEELPPIYREL